MIYAKPRPFERSCAYHIISMYNTRAYAETDGEVKQVRGVNARRYSKIRGPDSNITIINTKCGHVKPNTK